MFWAAIRTGLITYTEAKYMYMDELLEVLNAEMYFHKLEDEYIQKSTKQNSGKTVTSITN